MVDKIGEERQETRKKSYKRPQLAELGSLEQITKGPEGGNIDSLFGSNGGFQPVMS